MDQEIDEMIDFELDEKYQEDCFTLRPHRRLVDELVDGKNISAEDIANLKKVGICTLGAVARSSERTLAEVEGFSKQKAEILLQKTFRGFNIGLSNPRTKLHLSTRSRVMLTTGSEDLDKILGGGIRSGGITELFGDSDTGKTNMCHTLAVTCQLPFKEGGGEGRCVYIDTEGTFKTSRIFFTACRYFPKSQKNPMQIQDHILVRKCPNTDHLTHLLHEAATLMSEGPYLIIIIDSISKLYNDNKELGQDPLSKKKSAIRKQHLTRFLEVLNELAKHFEVPIIVTNRVEANENQNNRQPNSSTPNSDTITADISETRLIFLKRDDETCEAHSSSSSGLLEVQIATTPHGIYDRRNAPSPPTDPDDQIW